VNVTAGSAGLKTNTTTIPALLPWECYEGVTVKSVVVRDVIATI
jgi:hypothetical protein